MCNFPNQISNHSPWTTKFQNMHEDDSYQDSDITNNLHIWGICRVKLVLWGDEVIAHSVKNKMSWMKSIKRFFKFFLTLYLDKILCQCVHWRTHHSQNFKKKSNGLIIATLRSRNLKQKNIYHLFIQQTVSNKVLNTFCELNTSIPRNNLIKENAAELQRQFLSWSTFFQTKHMVYWELCFSPTNSKIIVQMEKLGGTKIYLDR